MSEQVAVHLRVRGLVQGVFFRQSCVEVARSLGVCGWVRNEPDGAVSVLAQGEAAAVEKLVGWTRVGPSGARVAEVTSTDAAPDPALTTFQVVT